MSPAPQKCGHGKTPRIEAIQAACSGVHGARQFEVIAATGFKRTFVCTLLVQYVEAGHLFKAGAITRQRFYSTKSARDADTEFVAREESEYQQRKLMKKARKPKPVSSFETIRNMVINSGAVGVTERQAQEECSILTRTVQKAFARLKASNELFVVKATKPHRYFYKEAFAEAFKAKAKEESEARRKQRVAERRKSPIAIARQQQRNALMREQYQLQKAKEAPSKAAVKRAARTPKTGKELIARHTKGTNAIHIATPKPAVEIIIPENVKRTYQPAPAGRFEVSGPVVGGFATMGPGQYLDLPSRFTYLNAR